MYVCVCLSVCLCCVCVRVCSGKGKDVQECVCVCVCVCCVVLPIVDPLQRTHTVHSSRDSRAECSLPFLKSGFNKGPTQPNTANAHVESTLEDKTNTANAKSSVSFERNVLCLCCHSSIETCEQQQIVPRESTLIQQLHNFEGWMDLENGRFPPHSMVHIISDGSS